ncbi:Uridine monophosphate kinase [hydrothermal vent metagenome]|uniref:Uridylate kinase n=1 Tax=hydrothermal vent metagenome TaxID=652676 RepID=A0A3B0TAG8_9ZZZZ
MTEKPRYSRVLLKLSGEALMGDQPYGIDVKVVERLAGEVAQARKIGTQICLVIGGGNIFRGISGAASGMDRADADHLGMLATVMNAIAFQNALRNRGVPAHVLSAIPMHTVCEPYIRSRALRHIEAGAVVIFAAGTGNPFFTTDTTAALRAAEMDCQVVIKGTKVDGIYSADPANDKTATRYEHLTYNDALAGELGIMDGAAIALARDNDIPIIVFSILEDGSVVDVVRGRGKFTLVDGGAAS